MTGITRRSLLASGGLFLGLFVTGEAVSALAANQTQLRPPGAQDETKFLARCIRCQKCISVCPTRIIQPVSITVSIAGYSTPTVVFTKSYCDFCENTPSGIPRCAEVCPTDALVVPVGKPMINGKAVVDKKSCIAWDWKGCTVCVDECPQEAISLDEMQRPIVDIEACDGCGLCELVCPTVSLRSYSESLANVKGIYIVPNEEDDR